MYIFRSQGNDPFVVDKDLSNRTIGRRMGLERRITLELVAVKRGHAALARVRAACAACATGSYIFVSRPQELL